MNTYINSCVYVVLCLAKSAKEKPTHQHDIHQTNENYGRFKSNSPYSILPKTYRDALAVVASVGMRYIWIDSLCIIQDDENDWKQQSSVMGAATET